MNIFNHFELLNFEADTLIWEGQGNLIANPTGSVSASVPAPEMVIICTISVAGISATGACADVTVVGLIYVETAPAMISASGAVTAAAGSLVLSPGPAQATTGGAASIWVFAIVTPTPGHVAATGNSLFSGSLAILAGSKKLYECRLSLDGYDDLIVPISAFTSRQRAGDPSYSEVTIPGLAAITGIFERQTGTLTVSVLMVKNGVVMQREILFESEIASVSITGNTNNQQIMLSGYRTSEAANVPAVVPVSGVNYRSMDRGTITLRKPEPDLYLRPGDTVQYGDDEFVVGLITYSMSAVYGSSMEIREADAV